MGLGGASSAPGRHEPRTPHLRSNCSLGSAASGEEVGLCRGLGRRRSCTIPLMGWTSLGQSDPVFLKREEDVPCLGVFTSPGLPGGGGRGIRGGGDGKGWADSPALKLKRHRCPAGRWTAPADSSASFPLFQEKKLLYHPLGKARVHSRARLSSLLPLSPRPRVGSPPCVYAQNPIPPAFYGGLGQGLQGPNHPGFKSQLSP